MAMSGLFCQEIGVVCPQTGPQTGLVCQQNGLVCQQTVMLLLVGQKTLMLLLF
jgi:hypothetical protein